MTPMRRGRHMPARLRRAVAENMMKMPRYSYFHQLAAAQLRFFGYGAGYRRRRAGDGADDRLRNFFE